MKKLLYLFLISSLIVPAYAQCDKAVTLTVSNTQYLNAAGTVERTVDEKSTIEISKSDVVIKPGNEDRNMSGKIQSNTCAWKVPYKEGKSVIKARFEDPSGKQLNATLTLEGKNGKVTFLMEVDETPDRVIRVTVDKAEEKK